MQSEEAARIRALPKATPTHNGRPVTDQPGNGLGRAIAWTATTIARILHDALDVDARERRRDRANHRKNPPDAPSAPSSPDKEPG